MIGAIASKNASDCASRRRAIAAGSASDVSGPVATTPGDSSSVTSPRSSVIRGWPVTRSCTACANAARSTARAAPPGTRAASAAASTMLPSRRISALSRPCAFVSSTDLKELLQTSSASRSVWCAGVGRSGRISWSVTATPRSASAQAASLPASPPPTTVARRGTARRAPTSPPTPPASPPRPGLRVRTSGTCESPPRSWTAALPCQPSRTPDAQRLREAAFGVAGAGDERSEPPALHHQPAAARGTLLLVQLRQVVHVVDELLHVHRVERLRERPPEVAQHLLPAEVALLDLVELVLHLGREPDVEHRGERALHDAPHRLAERCGRETAILGRGVPAGLERRDDRRVGGRPPDPEPLQLLDEARFAVARRRLGEVLVGRDLLHRHDVALDEGRDRRQVLEGLPFLGLVRLVG